LFTAFLVVNLFRARANAQIYVRPIAGLEALDEAIGRATEMGRPVLYVPGLSDMSEVGTFAAITILYRSRIAWRRWAATSTFLLRSRGHDGAGRIRPRGLFQGRQAGRVPLGVRALLSAQQMAYVAAVNGYMLRAPAANIYMAPSTPSRCSWRRREPRRRDPDRGTDKVTQLPFFVCACDYTFWGGALRRQRLSGQEPIQLATIIARTGPRRSRRRRSWWRSPWRPRGIPPS